MISLKCSFISYEVINSESIIMHNPIDRDILNNRINLPVCDIHEKQARSQMLISMHSLANATSTISERQMLKCQEQADRIKVLGERIYKCKDRISHISTLKTAVTFVIPSQYPKYQFNLQSNKGHLSEFHQHGKVHRYDPSSDFKTKHDIQSFGKESKIHLKNMHECVGFILDELRMQPKGVLEKRKKTDQTVQNYGNIPSTFKYLDSLSVFGARVNPYRKYSIENNILKIEKRSKLSKENFAPIMSDYLSEFDRVRNISKVHRYVQPQQWIDHPFDLSLDLQNAVDIEGVKINEDSFEKKMENVINEEIKSERKSETREKTGNIKEQKVPVLNVEKNIPISIEERHQKKKEKDQIVVVPEIQFNAAIPIPPKLDLPIPPINAEIPSLHLPSPPKLDLPPPQLLPSPKFDLPQPSPLFHPDQATISIPADRGNLLQEIKNARNKLRLKPTITKESGVKKDYVPNEGPKQPDKESGENNSYEDMIAALKRRKQRRARALRPDQYAHE